MKIVIAPDSFKGTIRSPEVCEIIANAYQEVFPNAEIIQIPMADGGEGTTEALISALGGKTVKLKATGPLGDTVEATYGLIDNERTAVIEMASASGIELISRDDLNPMKATTFGTGEMILHALHNGVTNIIIGIGGSATVDGGIGMAQALGYSLTDANGNEIGKGGAALADIAKIEIPEQQHQLIKNATIKVACDVNNPLTGSNGAAAVYGPQKGATGFMVPILDDGLKSLLTLWQQNGFLDNEVPGDGAAGGLGAGLRAFCNAELTSGAELICDAVHLSEKLKGADLLITGEGKTDIQTLSGKLCSVVAGLAKEKDVPVLLISGALQIREELFEMVDYAFSASSGQTSLEEILADAKQDLAFIATNTAKLLVSINPIQK
jgi:glycerate 2-kinase